MSSAQPKDYDSILQLFAQAGGISCSNYKDFCERTDYKEVKYICANTCKTDTYTYVHSGEEDNNEAASSVFGHDCQSDDIKETYCKDSTTFHNLVLTERTLLHWACPATCNYDPAKQIADYNDVLRSLRYTDVCQTLTQATCHPNAGNAEVAKYLCAKTCGNPYARDITKDDNEAAQVFLGVDCTEIGNDDCSPGDDDFITAEDKFYAEFFLYFSSNLTFIS